MTSSQRSHVGLFECCSAALVAVLCLTAGTVAVSFRLAGAGLAQAQANSGGQSRCGTVTVATNVVQLGQTVMASAARGSGWTQSCGDSWSWGKRRCQSAGL